MSARASQEYRAFGENYHHEHDLRMIGMGLTLQNYVAELELLLFGVLTDFQTEYLHPAQVQERTRKRAETPQLPPSTPSSGRKESGSAESSRSTVIDDIGVIFRCTLAGEQAGYNLKIRIDPDSRLLLDFNEHVDQCLRVCDNFMTLICGRPPFILNIAPMSIDAIYISKPNYLGTHGCSVLK